MNHHRAFILGILLLSLSLFGGMQFFLQRVILWFGAGLGWIVILWAAWLLVTGRQVTPLAWPLAWLLAGASLATVVNRSPSTWGQLWLYCLAVAVVIVANRYLTARGLYVAFWWAGLFWPAAWAVATLGGWWDSPNVAAFWSFLFVIVGLHGRIWLYLVPHTIMLLALASRGALVGAAIGVWLALWLAWGRPRLSSSTLALHGLAIPLLVGGLLYWRPHTAEIRLSYWADALAAWLANPFFGVGPGGLNAGKMIVESPGVYQLHAHNFLLSWAAQTGAVGLACLYECVRAVTELRRHSLIVERWQIATLAGLLAWSMVDEPLFWPGPLLATALIVGTIQERIL